MQRLTKYRLLVGSCALIAGFTGAYAFATQRETNELRTQLANATRQAAESSAQAASAIAAGALLQRQLDAGSDDLKCSAVISAFAAQAEACLDAKAQPRTRD